MKFNRFVWELYCHSASGRATIESDISDYLRKDSPVEVTNFKCQIYFHQIENGECVENGLGGFEELDLRELIREGVGQTVNDFCAAETLFTEIADDGLGLEFENQGKKFARFFGGGKANGPDWYSDIFSKIAGLSAGLHDAYPEFFAPYLFSYRFDEFERICRAFDIPLPPLPGKLQKRERALFYLSINRALYEFRNRHDLSPRELNAFLYDFAPKSLESKSDGQLPPPSRIWFVIGGVGGIGDFQFLDDAGENTISRWQGSLETRKGDIVLIWCASPRSYLHSVWRAMNDGFNDPFFYFYSLIRVGQPTKIIPLPFSEFANHPLLGGKPAVRAHFQGASGTPFSLEDYAAIRELLREKGFDVSLLPIPPPVENCLNPNLGNERDVEEVLLEPLLRRLGFTDKEWIRQFPLRMGRGERNYPDYVLGGDPRPGEESAVALIECKFDIETKKEIKEAFVQAKSYALRLQASVLALAARRGFWLFRRRADGFSLDHYLFKTWNELAHPDVLHEVSLVIGKRAVDTAAKAGRKTS